MILRLNNIPLFHFTEVDDNEVFRERDQEVISPANDNDMDSRIGLDYIVENSDYVSKLAAALDTNNEVVKKQVFELLSALCAYSHSGYCRAIETLENYKVNRRVFAFVTERKWPCRCWTFFFSFCLHTFHFYSQNLKAERYRLKVVVAELDKTAAIEYKVSLLAFINCVIISAKSLQDRLRVRNEFIGERNSINHNLSSSCRC